MAVTVHRAGTTCGCWTRAASLLGEGRGVVSAVAGRGDRDRLPPTARGRSGRCPGRRGMRLPGAGADPGGMVQRRFWMPESAADRWLAEVWAGSARTGWPRGPGRTAHARLVQAVCVTPGPRRGYRGDAGPRRCCRTAGIRRIRGVARLGQARHLLAVDRPARTTRGFATSPARRSPTCSRAVTRTAAAIWPRPVRGVAEPPRSRRQARVSGIPRHGLHGMGRHERPRMSEERSCAAAGCWARTIPPRWPPLATWPPSCARSTTSRRHAGWMR